MSNAQSPPENLKKSLKICFVVPYAYSLFNQQTKFPFGGSEVRAWFIGKGIALDHSLEISFVVFNHMQDRKERHDNIEVWRDNLMPPSRQFVRPVNWWRSRGITRRLGNIIHRITSKPEVIIRPEYKIYSREFDIYQEVDADVYCVFGVHDLAAKVGAFCVANSKRFVVFSASDEDFSTMYYRQSIEVNPYGNVGYLADYAIRQADTIICQTDYQAWLCRERFCRDAFVVRNPAKGLKEEPAYNMRDRGGYILWVGKSDYNKSPEVVLELAKKFPDIHFIMVISMSSPALHRRIFLNQLPNLEIIDYLPYGEIEQLFRDAVLLLNTSKFEGFPNTFLQAGVSGVPIASLNVDPDGFIADNECGISAKGDMDDLVGSIQKLLDSPDLWRVYAENIFKYVSLYHDPVDTIQSIKNILTKDKGCADLASLSNSQ